MPEGDEVSAQIDTDAACGCFEPTFGAGSPEYPLAVDLPHAGGGGLHSYGKVREVSLHTGRSILPTAGVVADVSGNLVSGDD